MGDKVEATVLVRNLSFGNYKLQISSITEENLNLSSLFGFSFFGLTVRFLSGDEDRIKS